MTNIALITTQPSDFSHLLKSLVCCQVETLHPDALANYDLAGFDAFCILGGTSDTALVLPAASRVALEAQMALGKRVFAEFVRSIDMVYAADPVSNRFHRLVYQGEPLGCLGTNDILDDQCNQFISTYWSYPESRSLLIDKAYINAHSAVELDEDDRCQVTKWALWELKPNILLCNFRICNFTRARFSPVKKWREIVGYILSWLAGETVTPTFEDAYTLHPADCFPLNEAIESGIRWFERANMLLDDGRGGVLEGYHHDISPDGTQKIAPSVRTDCVGEVSMAYLAYHLKTGDKQALARFHNLQDFIYNKMQIKDGPFRGMLRWTDVAWGVCYQDDVARALLSTLLYALYTGGQEHLEDAMDALRFLVRTTGTDGLRTARTDNILLTEESLKKLADEPANFPSAHYNSYYLAALLLAHRLTGDTSFRDIGVRGLEAIMAAYPNTTREQSETEELCRLVLPLSWLYWITGDDRHKQWLYQVTYDLKRLQHPSGAYLEWDTDYKASCSRKRDSECSLLTENGDSIVDLLYSNNWLPLGFLQAYLVTDDPYFYDLWKDNARFFLASQIRSTSPALDGCWARGFDPELMDVYGVPHDVGWGPWAVETGWTVAEILSGLTLGSIADSLKTYYQIK